jgi:hypothetical protein
MQLVAHLSAAVDVITQVGSLGLGVLVGGACTVTTVVDAGLNRSGGQTTIEMMIHSSRSYSNMVGTCREASGASWCTELTAQIKMLPRYTCILRQFCRRLSCCLQEPSASREGTSTACRGSAPALSCPSPQPCHVRSHSWTGPCWRPHARCCQSGQQPRQHGPAGRRAGAREHCELRYHVLLHLLLLIMVLMNMKHEQSSLRR